MPLFDVHIIDMEGSNPPGKLADVELHFRDAGVLAGLKLIGFSIWERRSGSHRNVTFPCRQYSVNGERRSYALLRPVAGIALTDGPARENLTQLILRAYDEHKAAGYELTAKGKAALGAAFVAVNS